MVVLCGITLDDDQECIYYTCIAVAKKAAGNKEAYSPWEVKHVIGQMLEIKQPGITNDPKFVKYSLSKMTKQLRNPHNKYTIRLKEKAEPDLDHWLEQVSQLYRKSGGATQARVPPPTGPAKFREPGRLQNLRIHNKVLSPDQLSTIYAAAILIVSPSGEGYSIQSIKGMVGVMLNITRSSNFTTQSIAQYVDIFRGEEQHWLTTKVAKWTRGERQTEICGTAIELLKRSGHPDARERVFVSTAQCVSCPSNNNDSGDDDDNEDDDDDNQSDIPVTESLGSMNLGAFDQRKGLQPSARGSISEFAQPRLQQITYQSNNSVYPPPPAMPYYHPINSPAHLSQQYLSSSVNPQSSAYDPPGGQQLPSLGSNYYYAGPGYQQSLLPGGGPGVAESQRSGYVSHPMYYKPPPQPSAYASPFAPVPAQWSGSQSGFGQAQSAIMTTSHQGRSQADAGFKEATAKHNSDPSASSSSRPRRSASPDPFKKNRDEEKERARRKKPDEAHWRESRDSRGRRG